MNGVAQVTRLHNQTTMTLFTCERSFWLLL